ncbi:amidohydrolase family protein [Nostoc ellipsosporum NOK]|nr:amidohydrolase family protein [Nostoc ellipsosporum NOK]
MGFRKFLPDQLFDGYRITSQQVLITEMDGTIRDMVPVADAGDDVERVAGIISPGFVNAHCHLELSHLKNTIPPHTGLPDFLYQVVNLRSLPPEVIEEAIANADKAMYEAGIVAVGDICNTAITLKQKQQSRIYYHQFVEAIGFNPAGASARFDAARQVYEAFGVFFPEQQLSIVPHAPYSVTPELWALIRDFAPYSIQSIHNQECRGENEWFINKSGEMVNFYQRMGLNTGFFEPSGKNSLPTYIDRFTPTQPLLLVHNVCTSREDLASLAGREAPVYFCLCPGANLYISEMLPDIPMLAQSGVPLVIGTDSLASNHQLSILEEINHIRRHYPGLPLEDILGWATLNGAKALQADRILGSFEKGKQPGVISLDENLSRAKPLF